MNLLHGDHMMGGKERRSTLVPAVLVSLIYDALFLLGTVVCGCSAAVLVPNVQHGSALLPQRQRRTVLRLFFSIKHCAGPSFAPACARSGPRSVAAGLFTGLERHLQVLISIAAAVISRKRLRIHQRDTHTKAFQMSTQSQAGGKHSQHWV